MRSANAASKLVDLSESEFVGTIHDDGIGIGNVDAGFNDGGADQNIGSLVIKIRHHLLELFFAHLTMADEDSCRWHQLLEFIGNPFDVFYLIVQVINLTAAQQFPLNRFFNNAQFSHTDKRFNRQASGWGRRNDRQIPKPGHRQVQGSWDWCCGHCQYIDVGAHRFDTFFLTNAKAMLLIDDQQTQIFKTNLVLNEGVGANDDINLASCECRNHLILRLAGFKARDALDSDRPVRKAIAEGLQVLLCKEGRRHQDGNLLSALDREKSGAHGDFCFTETDIAADQSIGWLRVAKIRNNRLNGAHLVGGFLEGKGANKLIKLGVRHRKSEAQFGLASSIQF